jgi:hypothetical protein
LENPRSASIRGTIRCDLIVAVRESGVGGNQATAFGSCRVVRSLRTYSLRASPNSAPSNFISTQDSSEDATLPCKIHTICMSSPHFQTASKQAPSKSQAGTSFMPIAALRLTPVALTLLDPEVVLKSGVAVAVGVVPTELGPVILTLPSSPPTRQAIAY